MDHSKFLIVAFSIVLLTVSGCGEKKRQEALPTEKPETAVTEGKSTAPARPSAIGETAGGPVAKLTPKMVESSKEIILEQGEMLVSDFEGWPNNLGGEIGVYGSLEPNWDYVATVPYSWVYEPITPSYNINNVHSGKQAFRLVNGLGSKPDGSWGSFAMDLGPTTDLTVVPKRVISLDTSGYKYLTFWAKGERGGEKMEFLARDSHALNYNPQIKYKLPDSTTEWQKIVVPLEQLSGKIDLTQLDNIGIAFGCDVGNMQGDIAYIDDFVFTNTP